MGVAHPMSFVLGHGKLSQASISTTQFRGMGGACGRGRSESTGHTYTFTNTSELTQYIPPSSTRASRKICSSSEANRGRTTVVDRTSDRVVAVEAWCATGATAGNATPPPRGVARRHNH